MDDKGTWIFDTLAARQRNFPGNVDSWQLVTMFNLTGYVSARLSRQVAGGSDGKAENLFSILIVVARRIQESALVFHDRLLKIHM